MAMGMKRKLLETTHNVSAMYAYEEQPLKLYCRQTSEMDMVPKQEFMELNDITFTHNQRSLQPQQAFLNGSEAMALGDNTSFVDQLLSIEKMVHFPHKQNHIIADLPT